MKKLFNEFILTDYIGGYKKALKKKIDQLEIKDSTDLDSLVSGLKSEFIIHQIELKEPVPSEPIEKTILKKDIWDETVQQKVYEIYVKIPFEGNQDLFYCHPSVSKLVYFDKGITINSNSITAKIVLENSGAVFYNTALNRIIGVLKSNLLIIHSEIKPWNLGIETLIKQYLERKK